MSRVLLLGGTTEATHMARALAEAGVPAVFSYAGRTRSPARQPLPLRVGGFGGVVGLAGYMESEGISHVVDATHPFAAQMSRNAVDACQGARVALCALEREPWEPGPADRWRSVSDIAAAVEALPEAPARVFLAIGRQNLAAFSGRPQHYYLVRVVDQPGELPLPDARAVVARGPFSEEGDRVLLQEHRIGLVVCKNSGGAGARGKLDAARALGLPVIMIERPPGLERLVLHSVGDVMRWLSHRECLGV